MKKGIVKLISILAAAAVLSGCGSLAPIVAANETDRPILSAAEADAQIRVTVRVLPPIGEPDTIIAAND